MQASIKKGQRWSTAKGYLRPIMERENLHISIKSFVTKVNLCIIRYKTHYKNSVICFYS